MSRSETSSQLDPPPLASPETSGPPRDGFAVVVCANGLPGYRGGLLVFVEGTGSIAEAHYPGRVSGLPDRADRPVAASSHPGDRLSRGDRGNDARHRLGTRNARLRKHRRAECRYATITGSREENRRGGQGIRSALTCREHCSRRAQVPMKPNRLPGIRYVHPSQSSLKRRKSFGRGFRRRRLPDLPLDGSAPFPPPNPDGVRAGASRRRSCKSSTESMRRQPAISGRRPCRASRRRSPRRSFSGPLGSRIRSCGGY